MSADEREPCLRCRERHVADTLQGFDPARKLPVEQEVAAQKQAELHWRVDGNLSRDKAGETVLDISVRDANGAPVSGLAATARLEHPADARRDHDVPLSGIGSGQFHGVADAGAGRWELIIDLTRDGRRVFLSRSRVTLQ